jgi:hypothetical protein
MSEYQTVEVPFHRDGKGQFLTGLQIVQDPALTAFVNKFRHCFKQFSINEDKLYYEPCEAE